MAEGVKGAAERDAGEKGSGAAAAGPRRLPPPAAAGEPPGPARRPRRSPSLPLPGAVPPWPCLAHARVPSSSSAPGPRPAPSRHTAGAERGRRRVGEPGQERRQLPQFFAATGSPLWWAPRRPLPPGGGRREGHGRAHAARTCRLATGTARRCGPASPSTRPSQGGTAVGPAAARSPPPAFGTFAKSGPQRLSHTPFPGPAPQILPGPPGPPTPPAADPSLRSLAPPEKPGAGSAVPAAAGPGLREAAGWRGEASAMAERLRQEAAVASSPAPRRPLPPLE